MGADALIAQMLSQRRSWVELDGGLKVRVLRPPESDMPRVLGAPPLDTARECVDGWEGATEATLLGAGVGGSSVVEFDAELWAMVVADHTEWLSPIVSHVRAVVLAHIEAKAAAAKN